MEREREWTGRSTCKKASGRRNEREGRREEEKVGERVGGKEEGRREEGSGGERGDGEKGDGDRRRGRVIENMDSGRMLHKVIKLECGKALTMGLNAKSLQRVFHS